MLLWTCKEEFSEYGFGGVRWNMSAGRRCVFQWYTSSSTSSASARWMWRVLWSVVSAEFVVIKSAMLGRCTDSTPASRLSQPCRRLFCLHPVCRATRVSCGVHALVRDSLARERADA